MPRLELLHVDPGLLQELNAGVIPIELVVIDRDNAALLNEERAVDAGGMRDIDACAMRRVAVIGKLRDGVQFRVLDFLTGHKLPVDFFLAAVVVAGGHAVPAKRNNGVVLHDDAAHLEALRVAAAGRDLRDLHIHRVVFLDIHVNLSSVPHGDGEETRVTARLNQSFKGAILKDLSITGPENGWGRMFL